MKGLVGDSTRAPTVHKTEEKKKGKWLPVKKVTGKKKDDSARTQLLLQRGK